MKLGYVILFTAVSVVSCSLDMESTPGICDNVDPAGYSLYGSYVDSYGNTGIVVYRNLDPASAVNCIIVMSVDETTASWGPNDIAVYPVTEYYNLDYTSGPNFGLDVNKAVEYLGADRFPAFAWCHSKNMDRKPLHSSSWVLPTQSEMSLVFRNDIGLLNQALEKLGGTPVSTSVDEDGNYWTATEDIDGYFHFADEPAVQDYDQIRRAIPIMSSDRYMTDKVRWEKVHEYRVRAIKYIYYRADLD